MNEIIRNIKYNRSVCVKLTSWVILLMLIHITQAQAPTTLPTVSIPSPNAAALGKYVDFPVSYHTGVPQIELPIYELSEGPLRLPISLSYHAGGLKVKDLPSWVGAGWSLNAGGVITRTVRGNADDQVGSLNDGGILNLGSYLRDKGFDQMFPTIANSMDGSPYPDFSAFGNGQKDGQPDLFFFNFAGLSGEFYFNEAGKAIQLPESDFVIEPILNESRNYRILIGFKITTTDGTKFYFGETADEGDVNPVERSDTDVFDPDRVLHSQFYSSWFLHRVESADSLFHIDLTYEAERYSYYTSTASPCIPDCDGKLNATKIIIEGVRLSQISSSNINVNFVPGSAREDLSSGNYNFLPSPNTEAKRLAAININSNSSADCKTFEFNYGYFQSPNTPLPRVLFMGQTYDNDLFDDKRLKLLAVQESSCNDVNVVPPYHFTYYDEDRIPRRMSLGYDHWGYNNGATDNNGLIPKVQGNYGSNDVSRDPKWPEMRAGAIKMIQYPTGGSSIYTYEPNSVNTYGINNDGTDLTYQSIETLSIGFGTYDSETQTYDLEVTKANYYKITTTAQSSGSGTLILEGNPRPIADVTTELFDNFGNPIPGVTREETEIFLLPPGTYRYIATANADLYSGSGIMVNIEEYTGDIDAFVEPRTTMVGGLRIKRIDKVTEETEVLSRTYNYTNANLYNIPSYIFKVKNSFFKTLNWRGADPNGCYRFSLAEDKHKIYPSPTNVFELVKPQGYHIGYNRVTEIQPDGGYTEHTFAGQTVLPAGWSFLEDVSIQQLDDICYEDYPEFPFAPADYDFTRGKIRSSKHYDSNDQLIKSTSFSESYVPKEEVTFGMIVQVVDEISETTSNGNPDNPDVVTNTGYPMVPSLYEIRTARMTEQEKIERVYNPTDSTEFFETTQITYYDNESTQLPTRNEVTTANGVVTNRSTYVKDLTDCEMVCPQCVQDFLTTQENLRVKYLSDIQNCFSQTFRTDPGLGCPSFYAPSQTRDDCVYGDGSATVCQKASFLDYHYRLNLAREAYGIAIRATYDDGCLTTGLTAADPEIKALYQLEKNNQIDFPIETITNRDGATLNASYNSFEIDGNSERVYLSDVYTTENETPIGIFNPADISGGSLVLDSHYRDDTSVDATYINGQIVELISTDGVITSYLWGYNNNLPIVKAQGVDHATLSTAYNLNPQNIRQHPDLADALITTYEYEPWSGMTKITDPNGIEMKYSYDDLGRLRLIEEIDNIKNKFTYKYLKSE